jgi:hypothetical protein
MSEESSPVLSGAIPSFEIFMTAWEDLSEHHPHLETIIKPGLDLAYKYYAWMDRSLCYVIAMRTYT